MKILTAVNIIQHKCYAYIACVYSLLFFVRTTCSKSEEIIYSVILLLVVSNLYFQMSFAQKDAGISNLTILSIF